MGVEYYLLCESDMTAYSLGKGAWSFRDDVLSKPPEEREAAVRAWFCDSGDGWLQEVAADPAAYLERVIREITAFIAKPEVRLESDAEWDGIWITFDLRRQPPDPTDRVYKFVGERYLRPEEYKRVNPGVSV